MKASTLNRDNMQVIDERALDDDVVGIAIVTPVPGEFAQRVLNVVALDSMLPRAYRTNEAVQPPGDRMLGRAVLHQKDYQ